MPSKSKVVLQDGGLSQSVVVKHGKGQGNFSHPDLRSGSDSSLTLQQRAERGEFISSQSLSL